MTIPIHGYTEDSTDNMNHPTVSVTDTKCEKCGRQLIDTWNYCPRCGSEIDPVDFPTVFHGI